MKERPILFSGPMVRAILEGRKTMTRRVVKGVPVTATSCQVLEACAAGKYSFPFRASFYEWPQCVATVRCPYGEPVDRLWVRETFGYPEGNKDNGIVYRATDPTWDEASTKHDPVMIWKPSIFMPRWASRITLEIKGVRVERLQAITDEDARAEGVEAVIREKAFTVVCRGGSTFEVSSVYQNGVPEVGSDCPFGVVTHVEPIPERVVASARYMFSRLWKKINGPVSWNANPWVWVVEFEVLRGLRF